MGNGDVGVTHIEAPERPGRLDLYFRSNEAFVLVVTLIADGTPVDLTGCNVIWQVRDKPGGALLLDMSVATTRATLGGPAGTVSILVDQPTVFALTFFSAVHDMILVDSLGTPGAWLTGNACLDVGESVL